MYVEVDDVVEVVNVSSLAVKSGITPLRYDKYILAVGRLKR
jgi:hypothetical protein